MDDAGALQHLRDQLGLRLEGKVNGCPTLESTGPGAHPRAEVYVNFQDPAGDDYGRTDTFNFDIENGKYEVTVSIGWSGRTYSKQRVVVEGNVLFDNVETNAGTPYLVKTVTVDVSDGNVTLEAGQQDEYTMLNWMSIVPK